MLYYSGNIWCCLIFTIPVSLIYALLKILKAWDFCTQIMIKNRVKSFHTFKHARPRLLRKKLIIKSLTHTYVKSCNRQFKTRVSIVRVESIFINASKHLKKPDQYAKRCIIDIENHIKGLIQHCERSELRLQCYQSVHFQ